MYMLEDKLGSFSAVLAVIHHYKSVDTSEITIQNRMTLSPGSLELELKIDIYSQLHTIFLSPSIGTPAEK